MVLALPRLDDAVGQRLRHQASVWPPSFFRTGGWANLRSGYSDSRASAFEPSEPPTRVDVDEDRFPSGFWSTASSLLRPLAMPASRRVLEHSDNALRSTHLT